MRHKIIFFLILTVLSALSINSQVVLTRNSSRASYRALIAPKPGEKYFLHAQRIDVSNTRSISVGFCIHYVENDTNSRRNSTFYVPNADRTQRWEFQVRDEITVYEIEAMQLTDEGHHWKVWIEKEVNPQSENTYTNINRSSSSADYDETMKYLENIKAELMGASSADLDMFWIAGHKKTINGNSITRISGGDKPGEITNISYQTLEQKIDGLRKRAEKEKLDRSVIRSRLDFYREYAEGGVIKLYIRRGVQDTARIENYTVILENISGDEIYRKRVSTREPRNNPVPDKVKGGYHNINLYWIPDRFLTRETRIVERDGKWVQEYLEGEEKFYILVIDETSKKRYKFEVILSQES